MNKKWRKRISLLLVLIFSLSLLPAFPQEVSAVDCGGFHSGSGSQADPWLITTPEELDNVRNYLGSNHINKYFKLGNNIDLTGYLSPGGTGYNKENWGAAGWLPIGGNADEEQFTGNFDGQYFTITGLSINRPNTDYVGLFAVTGEGGVVSNVGLQSVDVIGKDFTGGLAGAAIGPVNNSYTTGSVKGNDYTGGLLGAHFDALGEGKSTPFVFTSDREGNYHFIKELGLNLRYYKQDYLLPNDYAQLDSDLLQPRDGSYHINITNEFNEIPYLDRISLLTFDHPAGYTPAFSFLRLDQEYDEEAYIRLVSSQATPVDSVVDTSGNDYTEAMSSREDDEWTSAGSRETDFFNPIEIDLGDLSEAQQITLVLEGMTHLQLLRENGIEEGNLDISTVKRMIQVPDGNGGWVDAYSPEELRQPLNTPSLKFVDLTDKFVNDDYRVRIGFNYVCWSYIAVDTLAPPAVKKRVLSPQDSELNFRGFSAVDKVTYPYWTFDYSTVSPIPKELYAYQSGNFTRYGGVTPLLEQQDDQYVIMNYGDELALKFDYTGPESGMERSYVLSGAVWYKSANEPSGRTVDPLPFTGMDSYPYDDPGSFPEQEYIQEWNTRTYPSRGGPGNTITESYSTARVVGAKYVGGLVGWLKSKDVIDSYATGSVSGNNKVGGLVGSNDGTVIRSYASGAVTGAENAGGLVGVNEKTVTDSFYDRDITGKSDTGKGDPKTTTQMQEESTFTDANWDFSTTPVWLMGPGEPLGSGHLYPYLAWQRGPRDDVPPVFMDDYPKVVDITTSSLDLNVKTDEAATAWYVVLPKDAEKPTAAHIKAGTGANSSAPVVEGSLALSAGTVGTAQITGLTANTDYDIYVVCEDSAGNLQPDLSVAKVSAQTENSTPISYSIGLSETGNHNFGSVTAGYGAQTPHSVTVSNTGTGETGALSVALSGTNASTFTLSKTSVDNIAASGSDSFTVVPNTGLAAGSYAATVTVAGGSIASRSFTVSFTVTALNQPVYSISLDHNGAFVFPAVTEGYSTQPTETVTITNTGNQPTGELTIGLSGTNSGSFTLSQTSIANITTSSNASFMVKAKEGLVAGTYRATVTVSADNMDDITLTVTQVVNAASPVDDNDNGGSNPPPSKTIAVTEISSTLFKDSAAPIKAEANMNNAFSNSVEVKLTDTGESGASFGLGSGTEVYPFDISLYIKGTHTKTQPDNGYAVTISLPIPANLLNKKDELFIVHKENSGVVTTLNSSLSQMNGTWYMVFEAVRFSPYALAVKTGQGGDNLGGKKPGDNMVVTPKRIYGETAYDTAVEIAKVHFPAGTETVILARGDVSADALPAVPLARKYNAPLLLTLPDSLPDQVLAEIKALGAKRVIIIGGPGAIKAGVEEKLKGSLGSMVSIERIYGQTHYDTAYEIALRLGSSTGQAVLVNGDKIGDTYPDALSIAPWAAFHGVPILYGDSTRAQLPESTAKAIKELKVKQTILSGGVTVLPEVLESQVPERVRYGGTTRYDTNAAVLKNLQPNPQSVYVATGRDFADALAGGAVAGRSNAWILLTGVEGTTSGLTAEQESLLKELRGGSEESPEIHILGGPAAVQEKTLDAVWSLLGN